MYSATISRILQSFIIVFISVLVATDKAPICLQTGPCTCEGSNYLLDLTPINSNTYSLSVNISKTNEILLYNPCSNFYFNPSLNRTGTCGQPGGVALCKAADEETESLGTVKSARFELTTDPSTIRLYYTDHNVDVYVLFNCTTEDSKSSKLTINEHNATFYNLTLHSSCACNGSCKAPITTTSPPTTTTTVPSTTIPTQPPTQVPPKKLSAGSILLILFFVFLGVYLVGGMLYRGCCLGAKGLELIPNIEFWMGFPSLVMDGVKFLLSCCKSPSTYDNI